MRKFDPKILKTPPPSRNRTVAERFDEFSELLHLSMIRAALSDIELYRWELLTRKRLELGLLYFILCSSGCRVSEVLGLTYLDFRNYQSAIIKGKKGSRDREISAAPYFNYFRLYNLSPCRIFQGMNYQIVRRAFIDCGVVLVGKEGGHNKVTHLPRHLKIAELYSDTNDLSSVQDIIGHKSTRSTRHYLGLDK